MPYINPNSESFIFTIPSGGNTSNAMPLSGYVPVGLYIPAGGWNASSVAFLAAVATGSGAWPVYMWQNGGRLEVTTPASAYVDVPYEKLVGVQSIILQTTYTGSALAQTGARVITAVVRPV